MKSAMQAPKWRDQYTEYLLFENFGSIHVVKFGFYSCGQT